MAARDEWVPVGFKRLIRRHRPAIKSEPIEVQQAIILLAWAAPTKSRAHREVENHMSIPYQELDRYFGRGGYQAINDRLQVFNTTGQWWSDKGLTRAFRLQPDLEAATSAFLIGWRKRMKNKNRELVGLDGKKLRTIPQAIASKDSEGITARSMARAAVKNLVPIDHDRLVILHQQLARMVDDPQRDLFIGGDLDDYVYRLEILGGIMEASRQVNGQWFAVQRYVESKSGRLYGLNIDLQKAPRSIKQVALHGMWEYDFENCHYTILHQLAAQKGLDCPAIGDYLAHKSEVRNQIAQNIGITLDQAKTCLISLIYGARFSVRSEDAIPDAIGTVKAQQLYQHPLFNRLHEDVTRGRGGIIAKWPQSRGRLKNAFGKWIRRTEGHPQILAHLLQGVEAQMLAVVRKLYDRQILLLQHDGFASSIPLDVELMQQAILNETGHAVKIEESRISLSPGLGIA
jgi:hypothetical protein